MDNSKQVVVFRIGDVQYGFPIEQVNEIIKYMAPNKIPNAPDFFEGVISLRGKVHAIINLYNLLDIPRKEADGNTRIIVANGTNAGFIVDEVNRIVTPQAEEVDTASNLPGYIEKNFVRYILKIDGDIIVVLNMASILDSSKKAGMTA